VATVGSGKWTFEAVPDWGRSAALPEFGLVSGVACDAQDNVYVFQRTPESAMFVFRPDGTPLRTWGRGAFPHAHGVWIGPDRGRETILVTDRDLHQVLRYSAEGERLEAWGTAGQPGAPGEPFNQPARAMATPDGQIFVADGYGQHRVHRLAPDGRPERSWGREGTGPGEFGWPVHTVWLDPRGRLLVADRGNGRIQHFTPDGDYLGEWGGFKVPQDLFITPDEEVFMVEGGGPSVTVLNLDGEVLCRFGERGDGPGQFRASPHSLWLDSRGDLYVGEVTTPNCFQKFARR
jgi:sugar lactone lactonase YvrE